MSHVGVSFIFSFDKVSKTDFTVLKLVACQEKQEPFKCDAVIIKLVYMLLFFVELHLVANRILLFPFIIHIIHGKLNMVVSINEDILYIKKGS